jgi:hypothetical protein
VHEAQAIAENTEIDTIIVRWSFKPLHYLYEIEKYSNTISHESRSYWIMLLRCDTQAGFAEAAWLWRPNGIESLLTKWPPRRELDVGYFRFRFSGF